jgi:hypothetical protein
VDEPQLKSARRWPLAIMGAFLAGAILWGLWMIKFVHQIQERQNNVFYSPAAGQKPAVPAKGTNFSTNDASSISNTAK